MTPWMHLVLICLMATVLCLAVCIDVSVRRIPNVLSVGLAAAALVMRAAGGPAELADGLLGAGIGFIALFPLWVFGGFGAGDVKLMAACGAVLGVGATLVAIPATLIAGGAIAVTFVVWTVLRERLAIGALAATVVTAPRSAFSLIKSRFPYALAIASGAGFAVWTLP